MTPNVIQRLREAIKWRVRSEHKADPEMVGPTDAALNAALVAVEQALAALDAEIAEIAELQKLLEMYTAIVQAAANATEPAP